MNNYIKKLSKNLVFLNRLDTDKEIVITVDSTIIDVLNVENYLIQFKLNILKNFRIYL